MRKTFHKLRRFGAERIGWEQGIGPFLFKKLPSRTGWAVTLGSALVLLFVTMFVTGVFLAMYYNPSPDKAYQAVDYIMHDVPAGWLLRGIHHWGASAMVIVVFLHMATNFFSGTYKKPREVTWVSGVIMLLIVLGLGFTGYLLPWDLKAYWATTVSTNIPKDIPVFGRFLSHLALGGDSISGATLTRFYAIHAMLLPALLIGFIAFHIYLVRGHGIAQEDQEETDDKDKPRHPERYSAKDLRPEVALLPARDPSRSTAQDDDARTIHMSADDDKARPSAVPERVYRFFPDHLWRSSIVFAIIFIILLVLSIYAQIPREPVAGTLVENYLPRPEWYYMWLFQLLTLFHGNWEAVGSLVIPMVLLALLFCLPFLDRRSRLMGVRNRPLPLAVGASFIVGLVYLTMMGFAGAKPYGQTILVPDRPLSASETRGLHLYADRECAYCHQIDGTGGHRVGPDLSNEIARHRTTDYLMGYIKNPQSINRTSVMPSYDLREPELKALADFILSLDFGKYPAKTVTREQALHDDGK